jgi:hypothetical protein
MAYRRARRSDPRDPILAIVSAFRQMSTGSDQSHRVKNGEGSMMERSAAIGRESSGRSREGLEDLCINSIRMPSIDAVTPFSLKGCRFILNSPRRMI